MHLTWILLSFGLSAVGATAIPPWEWNPAAKWHPGIDYSDPSNWPPGVVPPASVIAASNPTGTGAIHKIKHVTKLATKTPTKSVPKSTPPPVAGSGGTTGTTGTNGDTTGGDSQDDGDCGDEDDEQPGLTPISTNVPIASLKAVATPLPRPSGGSSSQGTQGTVDAGSPTGQKVCDATSTIPDKGYLVMANIWDQAAGGGGQQCAETLSGGGEGVAWQSEWSWNGQSIVSFALANPQSKVPCGPISSLPSIPSTFQWSYSTDGIVADVAYDIMTGGSECTPVGNHQFEIMIWLAAYGGLLPIGNAAGVFSTWTDPSGNAWDIYKGAGVQSNIQTVYSFYSKTNKIQSFSGDIADYLKHIASLDSTFAGTSLQSIQGGTEAQSGSATFTCSSFSLGGSASIATS